ncbi:YcxB family protein [Paenibacillus sp. JX-17]|uniref:YcxB family protein n=1 Tax=Paenibacillus lacisoli TaxID=3064525 RepID=A0ABT9CCE0_9BACL|nr:YcxB family protein [Paenibacillus sp. JX-17]MDO7906324.1 YcxB family protein [Paenibacillus sp. JX-17]
MNEITLDTQLRAEDVQEYNLSYSLKSVYILTGIGFVVYFILMFVISNIKGRVNLPVILAVDIAISAALLFYSRSSISRKSKKAFASDPLIQLPSKYRIRDEGLDYENESGSGHVDWEQIYKAGETRNLLLVFISSNRTLILPKRSFQSDGDITAYRKLMKQHLEPGKVRFKG